MAIRHGSDGDAPSGSLPAFDWLLGLSVSTDVSLATRSDAASIRQRRAQRLAGLLEATHRHSRYYRRLWGEAGIGDRMLEDLPVVRKRDLMSAFDEWVVDPELDLGGLRRFAADPARIADPYLGRYVVWESSGSSGEPGMFVQDTAAMAVYDALEALRRPVLAPLRQLMDPWSLRDRYAFVGAIGGHFAGTVSIERLRRLNPAMAGRLTSLSFLQPMARLVEELEVAAPTVVATYPTAAVLLAEERNAGRLKIAPREIWTGGENLTRAMRRYVADAFGCPVVDSYGASEFLALASECDHGRLHLNNDWAILEAVDGQGRPVPPGTTGATTLLTNLANRVQPLVRYDLGDRVAIHDIGCACGSPLPVISVQGRCDETLRLGATRERVTAVLPLALSTVLEDEAGLFDFQLIQQGPADLRLTTGLRGAAAKAVLRRARQALSLYLTAQGAEGVRIQCRTGVPCRPGRSGKIQRVIASTG